MIAYEALYPKPRPIKKIGPNQVGIDERRFLGGADGGQRVVIEAVRVSRGR